MMKTVKYMFIWSCRKLCCVHNLKSYYCKKNAWEFHFVNRAETSRLIFPLIFLPGFPYGKESTRKIDIEAIEAPMKGVFQQINLLKELHLILHRYWNEHPDGIFKNLTQNSRKLFHLAPSMTFLRSNDLVG